MTVEFLSPLDVRKLAGREWLLLAPLVYAVNGEKHAVPAGVITDFASVPRVPLAFLLFGGVGERAATVHDYLYQVQAGRDYADAVLRAGLLADEVAPWKAAAMHAGVRIGGASRYGARA